MHVVRKKIKVQVVYYLIPRKYSTVDEVVVRRGRLRWFGHVERMIGDDWVSACRNVVSASHLRRSIDHVTQIDRLERSGAID